MKAKHFKLGLAAFLAIAAGFAFAGMPIVPPDLLAAIGMAGFIGEVDLTEVKGILQKQGEAWDEYKKTNDERMAKMAKGESVEALEAKLAKMDGALNEAAAELKELAIKAARPNLGSASGEAGVELKSFNAVAKAVNAANGRAVADMDADAYAAYKSGFSQYIRRGDRDMSADERKAINVGTDPQGGYLIGMDMDSAIDRVVGQFSAMRGRARVVSIGNASWKKLVKTSGTSGGTRGGEATAPTEGTSPNWVEIEIKPGTYLSDQRITSEALEDVVYDVETDLQDEMGIEFAEMEGSDFISGNGVNGARGIASYTMVADASYTWGSTGFIVSGGASGFAASNPSDALISLQHALKRQYRPGASWMMNDATLAAIRKFKDGQGIYLWAPSGLLNGAVGQLLGHPVDTDDFMDDLGSNTFPIAFANFGRAYTIVDRKGMSILRDPYTAVPYVKFVGRRRVGGGITNFEAIKFLKCST